jgi:Lrp/AsnC family transcriptional regulator, leucine-responsive regulatory protein
MGLHSSQSSTRAIAHIREISEVLECARVTGSDTLILNVVASSVEHLERLIDRLLVYGPLTTSMVLSTPVSGRVVTREVLALERKRELTCSPSSITIVEEPTKISTVCKKQNRE